MSKCEHNLDLWASDKPFPNTPGKLIPYCYICWKDLVTLVVPECKYVGNLLTGKERTKLNLVHSKKWTYCDHPDKPLGDVVCPCKGCGTKCGGYSIEES